MVDLPPARFEGIVIYPDPDGAFEVRYPLNWHKFEVTHQKGGILFSPYSDHAYVWVAAWKDYISKWVTSKDIAILREGLDEGLQQLGEEVQILEQSEEIIGDLIRLERLVSFMVDCVSYKRRQWVFYAHQYIINLVYQARLEEFHHWSGMAYYSFHTFRLPDHIWFMTDQERPATEPVGRKGGPQENKKA
jgi:hypothetical protein